MKLISIPANPVPDDVVTGTLKTPDGVELRFARFAPPPGRKGTVCLFQGRAEFIEKYFETVRDLRARGFAVATLDWRGQGLSQRALRDPRKGHVESFREYESDLEMLMRDIVLPDCPPPYYALGHSMGASILMRIAHRGNRWFERMVLCAPLIELAPKSFTPFARPIVKLLNGLGMGTSYVPGGSPAIVASQSFLGNILTTDPVRHARTVAILEAAPELGLGSPTNAWASAAFSMMDDFGHAAYPGKIRQPILMIAAGRDATVSTAAIEEFAGRLRAGSHLIITGSRHEMMMEADRYRSQFWAAFDAFVPGTPLFA
jgi:lysophospholipase